MAGLPPGLALIGLRGASEIGLRGHSSLASRDLTCHVLNPPCTHHIGKREEGRGENCTVAFSIYSGIGLKSTDVT